MKKIRPHYLICDECAEKQGGKIPANRYNTVSLGDCPYCNAKKVTLTPVCDFVWPGQKHSPVWD